MTGEIANRKPNVELSYREIFKSFFNEDCFAHACAMEKEKKEMKEILAEICTTLN